jgi:16S rRNA (cytidine1402-2'-O)-methyltransferase
MNIPSGTLWLIATPIGNLEDFSPRAIQTLRNVDLVAAEDTRHSQTLLTRIGLSKKMMAYHEHNEIELTPKLIDLAQKGQHIALISDAGTPLISDPGYRLVAAAHAAGITVSTVPGPCAAIAALSLSGLATHRFAFEGFLPSKPSARRKHLQTLRNEPRTLIFYESKHRIIESLLDLADLLGKDRQACLARELTKMHETIITGSLQTLVERVKNDENQCLGEFVITVEGNPESNSDLSHIEGQRVYQLLTAELPPSQAAKLAARITGASRHALYRSEL